jgi:transcriptional regulator with XRE-family HTH domain
MSAPTAFLKTIAMPQDVSEKLKFAQVIRDKRKAMGISAKEIARSIDISQGALSRAENGYTWLEMPNMLRLASALGLPLSDLLREAGI